ncbi:hypothetical protein M0802_000225 [Mischocyttarus mexicanus]|nr:hypothetical protein M0802_000225 [Mischocyttarus mexicanus]
MHSSVITSSDAMRSIFNNYRSYFAGLRPNNEGGGQFEPISRCIANKPSEVIEKVIEPVLIESPAVIPIQSVPEVEVVPEAAVG